MANRPDPEQSPIPGWAKEVLARELGRLADPLDAGPEPVSTAPLAETAARLAQRLRAEAASPLPSGVQGRGGWRDALRRVLHRAVRPATRRSEVLAADLALLVASVAERLERLEADLRVLRARLDRGSDPAGPGAEGKPRGSGAATGVRPGDDAATP